MSRYYNDRVGLADVVKEAQFFLRMFADTREARAMRLDEARPFAGPYPKGLDRSVWRNRLNHALNRVLWRQHHFNQRVLAGALDALLLPPEGETNKPLLLVITPNDVTEMTTGGSARMWGLSAALAAHFRVELISITRWWIEPQRRAILPGVDLVVCPLRGDIESAIQRAETEVGGAATFLTVGDPALSNPYFDGYIRRVAPRAAAALMVGPFLHARFRAVAPHLPLFYDMHDDYAEYVGRMAGAQRERAIEKLEPMERRMIADCRAISCVSPEDADAVCGRCPEAREKLHLAANGVSVARAFRAYPSESLGLGRDLRLAKPMALFMGSVLRANLRAMSFIIEHLAPAVPEALFSILGVARAEHAQVEGAKSLPPNVVFCGRVPDSEKEALLALSCLALAPMGEGTGSSLKIPDYIAHGKPLITTPIGLRGFDGLRPHVDVVDLGEFAETVRARVAELMNRHDALDARAAAAWRVVKDTLDWSVIGRNLVQTMQPHLRVNV